MINLLIITNFIIGFSIGFHINNILMGNDFDEYYEWDTTRRTDTSNSSVVKVVMNGTIWEVILMKLNYILENVSGTNDTVT